MSSMKVLFLDIDGVLNSSRTRLAFGAYPWEFDERNMAMFDTVSINMIRGLCAKAGVSVVVSSAWRTTHGWDAIGRELNLPTISQTPSSIKTRGHEIQMWLEDNPGVEQYAIVDDDDDMLEEQRPYFVRTDGDNGLMWGDFKKLCCLFGIKPSDCTPTRIREGGATKLVWEES